jgi:Trk K+ transport system NAD-binding subunit
MGERFVLFGLSRLAVRVARTLLARGAEVVVVAEEGAGELAPLLPPGVKLVTAAADPDASLRAAGAGSAACILALSEDDRVNLEASLAASAFAPEIPLVVRSFDPVLTTRLEAGANLRRAYSVSRLAAPAFIAAALGVEVLHTLRLGDEDISLLRLRTGARSVPVGVALVARDRGTGTWEPVTEPAGSLPQGEEVVVGGPLHEVLALALAGTDLPSPPHPRRGGRERKPPVPPTLLPWAVGGLLLILAANVAVFATTLDLGPVDAIYASVRTAFGDPGLDAADAWLKVFGVGSMVVSAALVGVVFSQLASIATANRLDARMGRRARRMRGHAVVVGLGTVGYRIERLLHDLGVATVVLERDATTRFVGAVSERAPVLIGDVRLLENLERAGAARASMLFACTDDDLANLGACVQARRLHPGIRTVARVFDDALAERVRTTFGVDAAISATHVAAAAFATAATDELVRRSFELGGRGWVAMRWQPANGVDAAAGEELRPLGIHVLASDGSAAVLAGPEEVTPPSPRGRRPPSG